MADETVAICGEVVFGAPYIEVMMDDQRGLVNGNTYLFPEVPLTSGVMYVKAQKMHFLIPCFLLAVTLLVTVSSRLAMAYNEDHVEQLIQTRECRNCDFQGADFSGLDLQEVSASDSNFNGAKLDHTNLTNAIMSRVSFDT